MDKLKELIQSATKNGCAECSDIFVEINGGVVIYSLHGKECLATDAIDHLESFSN